MSVASPMGQRRAHKSSAVAASRGLRGPASRLTDWNFGHFQAQRVSQLTPTGESAGVIRSRKRPCGFLLQGLLADTRRAFDERDCNSDHARTRWPFRQAHRTGFARLVQSHIAPSTSAFLDWTFSRYAGRQRHGGSAPTGEDNFKPAQ
jgi:hypothetical protein